MALDGFTIGGNTTAPASGAPAASPTKTGGALSGFQIGNTAPAGPAKPDTKAMGGVSLNATDSTSLDIGPLISNTKPFDTSSMFSDFITKTKTSTPMTTIPKSETLTAPGLDTSSFNFSNLPDLSNPAKFSQESSTLNTMTDKMKKDSEAIDKATAALKDEESKVDTTDQKSVDAYNTKLKNYQTQVDNYHKNYTEYNTRVDNFNKYVGTQNTDTVYSGPSLTGQSIGNAGSSSENSLKEKLTSMGAPEWITNNPVVNYFGSSVNTLQNSIDEFGKAGNKPLSTQAGLLLTNVNNFGNMLFSIPTGLTKWAETSNNVFVRLPAQGIDSFFTMFGTALKGDIQVPLELLGVSPEISEPISDLVATIGQIYIGGKLAESTPLIKEKINDIKTKVTQDIITTHFPGQNIYFDSAKVKDIWQTGKLLTDSERGDIVKALGSDSAKIKDAIKNGVSIGVEPRTIVELQDKPYWSKIKSYFGIESIKTTISDTGVHPVTTIRGNLSLRNDVHPDLKSEINKTVETQGEAVVNQALQDKLGVTSEVAAKIIADATKARTPEDLAKLNKEVIGKVAPEHLPAPSTRTSYTPKELAAASTLDVKSHVDTSIKEGKAIIIDPDNLKKLAGNDYAAENARMYSHLAEMQYEHALETSKEPIVKIVAGGPGSGKSEIAVADLARDFKGIIYDAPNAITSVVERRIAKAVEAGKQVRLYVVISDPLTAREYALIREIVTGRSGPVDYHVKTHMGVIDMAKDVHGLGYSLFIKDVRNMTLETAKNSEWISDPEKQLDLLRAVNYNKEDLTTKISNVKLTPNQIKKANDAKRTRAALEAKSRVGQKGTGKPKQAGKPIVKGDVGAPKTDSERIAAGVKEFRSKAEAMYRTVPLGDGTGFGAMVHSRVVEMIIEGGYEYGDAVDIALKIYAEMDEPVKTQKEKVTESIKEKPKTIKQIAKETKILEPNVRRILGVGAKEGTFERVDKGVYTLSKDGQDIAWVETGSAVESLPRLASEGFKAHMVFLDIPYDTPAVKGGNRGVKYELLSVNDFSTVLDAVGKIVNSDNAPVIHMYSQAESGLKAMQKYNDLFIEKGFKPVGKGQYQKTFADGSPVTSPNGKVSKPEGILVFTKSGELDSGLKDLNFTLKRPKGYQTEKPAEMLKAMIEMTTKEGEMVLDPFAGSGVTGAEAIRAGRKAYSIERNADVAKNITGPRVKSALAEGASKFRIKSVDVPKDAPKEPRPDQKVTKTQVKDILKGLGEESIDMAVTEKDGEKFMSYDNGKTKFSIKPSAFGLIDKNIKAGDIVNLNSEDLKEKGTSLRLLDNKNMEAGFVNIEPLVKAVSNVSDFIEATNKGIEASKNLDDSLYTIEKNAEADRVMALQLVKKTKIDAKDAEAVYHYREDNSLPLTDTQRKLYEESKPIRAEINRIANKLKGTIPLSAEDRNSRFVKSKGNVIDRIMKGAKGIGGKGSVLSKSAPSLKKRTMKALTDENGNRTLVSIKDGQVTAIKDKEMSSLGSTDVKISPRTKEFFDKHVTPVLDKLAADLGITHIRTTQNQKGLGGNRAGVSYTGQNLIKTKVGTPERIILHEIGHQLDERYGLQELFKKDDARNYGRDTSKDELRAVADLRWDEGATESFKSYTRKSSEKMAAMFEAYLHVPDRFAEVAPNVYEKFVEFLSAHKELHPIRDLKPSLVLGSKKVGGEHIGGIRGNTFVDKSGKKYTVGEATTKEIESNTDLIYHKNYFVNDLVTYLNLRSVERASDFLEAYKESEEFKSIGLPFGEGEAPSNWTTTVNPSFRGFMLEPHVAAIMDKYASSMMKGKDPLKVLTAFNAFLRTTIFFNPFIHVPNIGVHWLVNRGTTPFVNPVAYARLARTSARAINAVVHLNEDYTNMLQSGAPLLYSSMESRNLYNALLQKMTSEVDKNPALDFVKKALHNINPYVISGKATWMINDIATMQAVYEEMEVTGKTVEQAIADVGAHIPNYRVPANKYLQLLNNSNITMFGAYHYGALRSYYEMAKTLVTGKTLGDDIKYTEQKDGSYKYDPNSKEAWKNRGDTMGKIMMLGIAALVIYPAIDQALQAVTGNKDAKLRRAGATTFPYNVVQVASGNMDFSQFLQAVITPAVGTKELVSQMFNRDLFTGQRIRDINASAGEQLKQAGEHALTAIAPIAQYKKLDSGVQTPGQFGASLVGVSLPDSVKNKLINAVNSAQTKVDKLDQTTVERVQGVYEQAKKLGFGTPEADALVQDFSSSDMAIYKDLKAIDTAKDAVAMKDKIQPIVEEAYRLGFGTPEADALVENLTDEEHAAYKQIKTILYGASGTGMPAFDPSTTTNDKSIIGTVKAYADAIRVDPITAFHRIFTNQRILRTENGTIIVERNDKKEASYKKELGGTGTEMTLDHLKSFELGGDNSESNMWLIPKDQAAEDDQVENYLGKALSNGIISGEQAQELEIRYKKGADAKFIDKRMKAVFDGVGSAITFEELKKLVRP